MGWDRGGEGWDSGGVLGVVEVHATMLNVAGSGRAIRRLVLQLTSLMVETPYYTVELLYKGHSE